MSATLIPYATVATTILIIYLSTTSNLLSKLPISDKLAHFFAYSLLSLLFSLYLKIYQAYPIQKATATVFIVAVALGGTLELIQLFIPGRSAQWLDFVANAAGAACGILIALILFSR